MKSIRNFALLSVDGQKPIFLVSKEEDEVILYNICDENLNLLSDVWFKEICLFDANGLAIVTDMRGSKNIINSEGKLLLNDEQFYCSIKRVNISKDSIFRVRDTNDFYNYVNQDGKFLRQEWLANGGRFDPNGFVGVMEANGHYNVMDEKGNFLLNDDTFDSVGTISDENKDFFIAYKKDKLNVIDKNLNVLCKDMWFDYVKIARYIKKVLFFVRLKGKYNLMDTDGKLLSPIWFDEIASYRRSDKYLYVRKNGKYNIINLQGQLVFRGKWFDAEKFSSPTMNSEKLFSIQNHDGFYYAYNLESIEKGL